MKKLIGFVFVLTLIASALPARAITSSYHPVDTNRDFTISFSEIDTYLNSRALQAEKEKVSQLFLDGVNSGKPYYYWNTSAQQWSVSATRPSPVKDTTSPVPTNEGGMVSQSTIYHPVDTNHDFVISFAEINTYLNSSASQTEKEKAAHLFLILLTSGKPYYQWNTSIQQWDTTAARPNHTGGMVTNPTPADTGSLISNPISAPSTPSITVTSPNGGETWQEGSLQTIKWNSAGLPSNARINIQLFRYPGNANKSITNVNLPASANSYTWNVETQTGWGLGLRPVPKLLTKLLGIRTADADSNYTYRVMLSANWGQFGAPGWGNAYDYSNSYFNITDGVATQQPSITVTSPNGGENFTAGQSIQVKWSTSNVPSDAVMDIYLNTEGSQTALARNVANTGSAVVGIPANAHFSNSYWIVINCIKSNSDAWCGPNPSFGVHDSSGYFTISAPTPTNVSLAPTFRYDQKSIYHRLFIDFGSNGGRIKSITQVSPAGTCWLLTTTVGQGVKNCSLGNASYAANSSCGVYLQMKSTTCRIQVDYYSGLSTRSAQFESYLPAGNTAGSGERIRQISDESASATTPSQMAAVFGVIQALINFLSGR